MRGHLFKRGKNKIWYCKIRINGKQKLIKLGDMKKHEAERALRGKLDEIEKNGYKDLRKATFRQLANQWLASLETSGLKQWTLESYKTRLNAHLLPYFGDMQVTSIMAEVIEAFKAEMSRKLLSQKVKIDFSFSIPFLGYLTLSGLTFGKVKPFTITNTRKISSRTVNYTLLVLQMILDKGVAWGCLHQNQMEKVDKIRLKKREFKALSLEQVGSLLKAAEGQDKTLLMVAVMSGLRQGEILAMKWENLNREEGTYTVKESYSEFGFDTPKTLSSLRTIPLPKPLLEELEAHRIRQEQHRRWHAGENWKNMGLVFTTECGTPLDKGNVLNRIFFPARDKAGLPKTLRFHDLRGTAATLACQAGANIRDVQGMLGHTTARLTLEVYAKTTPDSMRDMVNKMEAYLGKI